MARVSTSRIRKGLSDTINRVAYGGERIVLERRGKPIAAIVSLEDVELLERLEDKADVRAAKKALKEPGRIPWPKLKKKLGL
ncbi:MAG TPA: type II toxin-antitoxin system Phd/YefM family antitoxin [Planctomycetota bacterium]|nr:type II toxin-antitoxin system Phd/YefM family antitoxin [Planctomycetota bacterium]